MLDLLTSHLYIGNIVKSAGVLSHTLYYDFCREIKYSSLYILYREHHELEDR